jgi:hypothetical protein
VQIFAPTACQLRHTQPHSSRRTRKACAAGGGLALPTAYPTQRCRLGAPSRPPGKARLVHTYWSMIWPSSRKRNAADFGWHARFTGTPAPGCGRAAIAAAWSRVGATREADHGPSRERIERIGPELGTETPSTRRHDSRICTSMRTASAFSSSWASCRVARSILAVCCSSFQPTRALFSTTGRKSQWVSP